MIEAAGAVRHVRPKNNAKNTTSRSASSLPQTDHQGSDIYTNYFSFGCDRLVRWQGHHSRDDSAHDTI